MSTPSDGGGPGTIIVTWKDGTTSTYTLPADAVAGFTDDGKQLKFRAYAANTETGLVWNTVLNFAEMRGYVKSF